jgi:tRNA (guanine37-N1)-methyltransferase
MRLDVITIFPEIFQALTEHGVTGRAFSRGLANFKAWNPRDYTTDARKTVDDRAYGGGPGMVMMVKPLEDTLTACKSELLAEKIKPGPVILLSPQGKTFNQEIAADLSKLEQVSFICGRYEAVDQRFIDRNVDFELSLGDFVVSGGEIPAMAVMDAMIRLLPGALGDEDSALQDSFSDGLLDCPHYTRPENYENFFVPDVLLGGHHAKILDWRRKQSLLTTQERRPDLIEKARSNGLLTKADLDFLKNLPDSTLK